MSQGPCKSCNKIIRVRVTRSGYCRPCSENNRKSNFKDRFYANIKKTMGCHYWMGTINDGGYGQLHIGGRRGKIHLAHRVSYALANGEIPSGLFVCHSCDVRSCVNPEHLWVGTAGDNIRDAVKKGRFHGNYLKGEAHGNSKITQKIADKMRILYSRGGITMAEIGAIYGVTHRTVSLVCRKEQWV